MLNTIRADLYRLFRGKAVYITLICLLVLIALQVATDSVVTIGVNTGDIEKTEQGVFNGSTAPFAFLQITDNLIYFMLPFIFFIAASDFSNGCVKNALSKGMPRAKLYASKLILALAFCAGIMLIYVLTPMLAGTVMRGFGGELNAEYILSLLKIFGSQFFLLAAAVCVGISIVFITRRAAMVNTVYIAFFIVPPLLISALSLINEKFGELGKFDLVGNIRGLAYLDQLGSGDVVRALAVGGVLIAASTVLGLYVFNRCEIK